MSADVALVTCAKLPELDPDDRPLAAALAARGHRVAIARWDDPAFDWAAARLVMLRSPWDYYQRFAEFTAWAERVAAATALWNPLAALRWNLHKGYLVELAARGAPVVPTRVLPRGEAAALTELLAVEGWTRAILKPAVSADSWETLVCSVTEPGHGQAHLDRLLPERDLLLQPFLPSVEVSGERCLVFLDGEYSHAVRKNALTQGGRWAGLPEGVPVQAAPDELEAARAVLDAAGFGDLLYARVDLVRDAAGRPLLLELELAEPTLFLADHPAGLARLVAALERRLGAPSPPPRSASGVGCGPASRGGPRMNEPDGRGPADQGPHRLGDAYRVAFENGQEAIFIAQDGVFAAVNPAAARLVGVPAEDVVGRSLLEFIHTEDRATVAERYQRRLAGDATERSLTVRGVRPDGTVLWLEVHSAPTAWRERPAVIAFIAEVTDREVERRLAAEHERMLRRIAEMTPQFIFIYDYEEGRDVFLNRSVPAALGYGADDEARLQPYPFARLCHPDDFARAMERDERWREVPDGTVDAVEFRLLAATGEWRWFRSLNTPFRRDASGRVSQILGVSEDVTEQRRAAEALGRSEKLESLGVLAAGLAHDFGNLLTPVLGRAELLLARLAPDSPLRAHAEAIRAAAELAAELVEHLRVFSGKRSTELHALDLNSIVSEVVDLLRPIVPRDVRIELDLEPRLPRTVGDPTEIRQVVLNLLTNALEAVSDRGGQVALRSRAGELDAARLAALDVSEGVERGPAVVLEVEDDGLGMAAEVRARLWEPFFTTKPRGRGLGLPSVHGILRRHRAGLEVESRPGQGACFRVYLPAAPPREHPDLAAGTPAR